MTGGLREATDKEKRMAIAFNADEIFEMAQRIETNGAAFYRKAAGMFPGKPAEKLLQDLAAMEDAHYEVFKEMRSHLGNNEAKSTTYDPEGQAALYLQAFADGHIFDTQTAPADRLTGAETLADILQTAIGLEKDSVVFYTGLRQLVPAKLGKDRINAIIEEEMRHITTLNRELVAVV